MTNYSKFHRIWYTRDLIPTWLCYSNTQYSNTISFTDSRLHFHLQTEAPCESLDDHKGCFFPTMLWRAEASTGDLMFSWANAALTSAVIKTVHPGFQNKKSSNLRSSQPKNKTKRKSAYFLSCIHIGLKIKHYASTKNDYVTHSLQLFWLHWMDALQALIALGDSLRLVSQRDYYIFLLWGGKKLWYCHVIFLVVSCMQYTTEVWEWRKQTRNQLYD